MNIIINNCFGIGYRCTTDRFMEYLNIRKYSSPFSYMVCDLQTSIHFISSEFANFTDVVIKSRNSHNFKWNGSRWPWDLYFNTNFIPNNDNINVNELERICVWNHHNLKDKTVLESINRRINRLVNALKSDTNTLLIFIDNIQTYQTNDYETYFNRTLLMNFIKDKTHCYILFLVPLLKFPEAPVLYTMNDNIKLIFYESNMNGNTNDFDNPNIRWDLLKSMVLEHYTFNIIEKHIDAGISS